VVPGGGRPGVRAVAVTMAVCAALVLSLGGCNNAKRSPGGLATPTGSASPSVGASSAAAIAEVLRIYNGYSEVSKKAYETADYHLAMAEFSKYLAQPLLDNEVNRIYQLSQKGAVYQGTIGQTPKVVEVNLSGSPATATVEDCFDFTNWLGIDKNSHSPYPRASGSSRYIGTSTVTLIDGKGWRITDERGDRSRSC
jgi:hypothetical protein